MESLCISFSMHFCYSVEKNGNITTRGKISILVLDLLLLLSFFSFSLLFFVSQRLASILLFSRAIFQFYSVCVYDFATGKWL